MCLALCSFSALTSICSGFQSVLLHLHVATGLPVGFLQLQNVQTKTLKLKLNFNLAQVKLCRFHPFCTRRFYFNTPASGACSSSASQPASKKRKLDTDPSNSLEEEISMLWSKLDDTTRQELWSKLDTVEQPAPHQGVKLTVAARQAITLTPSTPLYDNFIANLESAVQMHRSGESFIDYITTCCFFGKFHTLDMYGKPCETPVPLSVKMEELLRVAQKQRDLHLERLRRRGDQRSLPNDMHMDPDDDMKNIYNTWREDIHSWMRPSTLAAYEELEHNRR